MKGKKMAVVKFKVFDNGGETLDRYTLVTPSSVHGFSENPFHPQGFGQFSHEITEKQFDEFSLEGSKKISINDLPFEARKFVVQRAGLHECERCGDRATRNLQKLWCEWSISITEFDEEEFDNFNVQDFQDPQGDENIYLCDNCRE